MWRLKWGNLSTKPNIGVVDDDIESRGFGQPHILRPLTIPQVAAEEVVVVEFEEGNMKNIVNPECSRKC